MCIIGSTCHSKHYLIKIGNNVKVPPAKLTWKTFQRNACAVHENL